MPRYLLIFICIVFQAAAFAASPLEDLQQQIDRENYQSAIQQGEQLMLDNPEHIWLRFLTAYAYQQSGQADKATTLYQGIIRDSPGLPEPRNNLAMIYLQQGDYDRASQLLVDAINTHPSYATAYENLSRIYKGLASEAYRRAISESSEPAKYTHNIELAAIGSLEGSPEALVSSEPDSSKSKITTANIETLLLQKIKGWASAWSQKDVTGYSGYYSSQYRAKFANHDQWLEYRRQRINRPGEIRVEINKIQIRWKSENQAIIDFRQRYNSPRYSDHVVKRLIFSRQGNEWKITEERVLSVL